MSKKYDKSIKDWILKNAYSVTQSLYKGVDKDGKEIEFTATDLVSGKVKPGSLKKWKGKSLSERVMSKGYGKVRSK